MDADSITEFMEEKLANEFHLMKEVSSVIIGKRNKIYPTLSD